MNGLNGRKKIWLLAALVMTQRIRTLFGLDQFKN